MRYIFISEDCIFGDASHWKGKVVEHVSDNAQPSGAGEYYNVKPLCDPDNSSMILNEFNVKKDKADEVTSVFEKLTELKIKYGQHTEHISPIGYGEVKKIREDFLAGIYPTYEQFDELNAVKHKLDELNA